MKIRKFYPRQVLRALRGDHACLSPGQLAAVRYFSLKGRRLGLLLAVGSTATAENLLATFSLAEAQAVIANASTRIFLKESTAEQADLYRSAFRLTGAEVSLIVPGRQPLEN